MNVKNVVKGASKFSGMDIVALGLWLFAGVALALVMFLALQRRQAAQALVTQAEPTPIATDTAVETKSISALPEFVSSGGVMAVSRNLNLKTIIPTNYQSKAIYYTVEKGDSVFWIAKQYDLEPETVLWANYDQLNDNPNNLSIGATIIIPPTDGIYYKWKVNDTLEAVAAKYKSEIMKILTFPGNNLDITNPVIQPDSYVMIPDGWRETVQWLVPDMWRPSSGASRTISGPGGCELSSGGAVGGAGFIWPADNHSLSGNDYWSGHLGIDIAAAEGAAIYASDSGMVVYAGAIGGGYGNMVMIDHGNGFRTLYAHLSQVNVSCGQSVYQGAVIGLAGSTGNSTGAHLHFEVRYSSSYINPWSVLN